MNPVSNSQLVKLRNALLAAFPTANELEHMVFYSLEINLHEIVIGNNLTDKVSGLLLWALSHGKLQDLIDGASKENPHFKRLLASPRVDIHRLNTRSTKRVALFVTSIAMIITLASVISINYFEVQPFPISSSFLTPSNQNRPVITTVSSNPDVKITVNSIAPVSTETVKIIIHFNDWQEAGPCLGQVLIPDYFTIGQENAKIKEWISNLQRTHQVGNWTQVASERDNGIHFQYLTGISADPSNKAFIELIKTATATVIAQNEVPDQINSVTGSGCGGPGKTQDFSTLLLESTFKSYIDKMTMPGVDYYSLAPGEFQYFSFQFRCVSPGFYQITINLPYKYIDEKGVVTMTSPNLICPRSFVLWNSADMQLSTKYSWNGTKYEKVR